MSYIGDQQIKLSKPKLCVKGLIGIIDCRFAVKPPPPKWPILCRVGR